MITEHHIDRKNSQHKKCIKTKRQGGLYSRLLQNMREVWTQGKRTFERRTEENIGHPHLLIDYNKKKINLLPQLQYIVLQFSGRSTKIKLLLQQNLGDRGTISPDIYILKRWSLRKPLLGCQTHRRPCKDLPTSQEKQRNNLQMF